MKKGHFYILVAVSIWAIGSGVLIKLINIPALALYSIGVFFGTAYLIASLLLKRKLSTLFSYQKKKLFLMLGLGLGIAINNGFFFTALKIGSVANAILTHYLMPIFVVLIFAPMMLKDKITLKKLVLSFLGFAGLFVLMLTGLRGDLDLAIVFGAMSAVFFAFHTVLEKKVTKFKPDPLSVVVYKNLGPLVLFSPFAAQSINRGIAPVDWILLVVLGVSGAISMVLFFKGLKEVSATDASILSYGEPIGAILLASIFLGESVGIFTLIGGLMIVISGIGVIKEK